MKIKTEDFGVFVIFTAIYAAGTLGMPDLDFQLFQIRPGEIFTPFVAIFGGPAAVGLALGQLIASTTSKLGPMEMISPIFALIGFAFILYLRKLSALAGNIAYIMITSLWFAYLIVETTNTVFIATLQSTMICQTIAIIIGYIAYQIAGKTIFKEAKLLAQPEE